MRKNSGGICSCQANDPAASRGRITYREVISGGNESVPLGRGGEGAVPRYFARGFSQQQGAITSSKPRIHRSNPVGTRYRLPTREARKAADPAKNSARKNLNTTFVGAAPWLESATFVERVPPVEEGQRAEPITAKDTTRGLKPTAQHMPVEPASVRCRPERTDEQISRAVSTVIEQRGIHPRSRRL